MKILTLDPGGTTGWCSVIVSEKGYSYFETGQIEFRNHHKVLWDFLNEKNPDLVISESFEYRNQARAGLVLVSKEYIGICKLWCILNGKEYREQMPATAMGFVKDVHIKNLNQWYPNKPHAMDAARHMMYYIINGPHLYTAAKHKMLKLGYRSINT